MTCPGYTLPWTDGFEIDNTLKNKAVYERVGENGVCSV